MSTRTISPYHYAKVPAHVIEEVKKPRALQILSYLLTLCNPNKPEVWIDQRLVGLKLGIHQDTAGTWIRYLEKIGQLAFIGYRNDGRRKRYRINNALPEIQDKSQKPKAQLTPNSLKITGGSPVTAQEDIRPQDRNINREEETNNKEQTVVQFFKNEFSSNEKIALKQKLKSMGIFKQSIEKLVAKYSAERIENQIKHLEHLLEQGKNIEKPASWLMKAIEQNFSLPETIDPSAIKSVEQEDSLRRASMMAQDAKFKLDEGNLDGAKDLATRSLQLAQNTLAQKTLQEINDANEKAQKIREVRAKLSDDEFHLIQEEEEQNQLIKMRKFGKSGAEFKSSSFFKNLVASVVDQRLLARG